MALFCTVAFHIPYSIVGVLPFLISFIGICFLCIRASPPPCLSLDLLCSQVLYEFCCSADWLTHASPSCVSLSHVSVIRPISMLLSVSSWSRSWSLFLTDLAFKVAILRYGMATSPLVSTVLMVMRFWVFTPLVWVYAPLGQWS